MKIPSRNPIEKFEYFSSKEKLGDIPIVDLRSPKEYVLGHIPGAVNIPLFSDDERHQVGWTYKQVGKLEAIQLGLELVASKVDSFLEQLTKLSSEANQNLAIYCWRGGMRSNSVAKLLQSVGVSVRILEGGYKGYRRNALELLSQAEEKPFLVLMGRTGVGKTEFLRGANKVASLDFEFYANHRGSVFGDLNQSSPLPSQQNFENRIVEDLHKCKNSRFILVEIENYFGNVNLPKVLREKMLSAPVVVLKRSLESRVEIILQDYISDWSPELCEDVCKRIEKGLGRHFPVATIESLQKQVRAKNLSVVVSTLLDIRYDPLYDKKLKKHKNRILTEIDVTTGYSELDHFIESYLG